MKLLADIRDPRSLADQARLLEERRMFVALMRGERDPVVRLRVVPPARRAA